jgi:hypothetical protein
MKKVLLILAVAATILCGCDKDKNKEKLSDKLIGKWIQAEINGWPALTNEKMIITFVSDTKAVLSASRSDYTQTDAKWDPYLEYDLQIADSVVTVTAQINEAKTVVFKYIVNSITDNEMSCHFKATLHTNGNAFNYPEEDVILKRVTVDYKNDVIGLWEGRISSQEGSEFDDGELHRWEYKTDGTYVYYRQTEDGQGVSDVNSFSEYFVDGNLLCTRWMNNGEGQVENREWWEIASIKDGVMLWTALRAHDDGTTYVANFSMTKVN